MRFRLAYRHTHTLGERVRCMNCVIFSVWCVMICLDDDVILKNVLMLSPPPPDGECCESVSRVFAKTCLSLCVHTHGDRKNLVLLTEIAIIVIVCSAVHIFAFDIHRSSWSGLRTFYFGVYFVPTTHKPTHRCIQISQVRNWSN